jgi:hypothetical protein
MSKYKTFGLILPLILGLTALLATPDPPEQTNLSQSSPAKSRKKVEVHHFPVVEFSSPETKESKRKARGEKRNKSNWNVDPNALSDSTVLVDAVDVHLPAFPTKQSAAVVIGTITDAKAYLSSDKTGIYSTFVVVVEEVLKNSGKLSVGNFVEAEREGGRVKFPSGRLHLYKVSEQDMPRVGARYVLFLTETDSESVFQILTGYEIREASIYPLDELPQSRSYENTTASTFVSELRMKLANP